METSTLLSIISKHRSAFDDSHPEMKKGIRFYSNERVISRLRTKHIIGNENADFNFEEEFLNENVPKILGDLALEDWYFSSKQKWGHE